MLYINRIILSGMNCRDCNRPTGDFTHDRCHLHAFCAIDFRYDRSGCAFCLDLWARIRGDDPADAVIAMDLLQPWVNGFAKNSRNSKWKPYLKLWFYLCHFSIMNIWLILDNFIHECIQHKCISNSPLMFLGERGLFHWVDLSQWDEYQELLVLTKNFRLISKDAATQVMTIHLH